MRSRASGKLKLMGLEEKFRVRCRMRMGIPPYGAESVGSSIFGGAAGKAERSGLA
jgi:hypothetical protein